MPYKEGFEEVAHVGLDYTRLNIAQFFEPLYNLTVYIITFCTTQPVFLFLIIAAIAVILNSRFYAKYSEFFLLSLLLYFVHTFLMRETMQIRAGVAAGIVLWSLPFVTQQKPFKFLLLILCAMGFHLASGAFALIYPIYQWNLKNQVWKWLIGICLVIGILFPFGKLLTMLPGGALFQRIKNYSWMVEQGAPGILTNPTIIKQLFFSFICLKYWKTLDERVPYFRLLVTPLLVSVCWLVVWNDFAIIAGRIGTFFSITEVLVVPMLLYLVTPRSRPVMGLLLVLYALSTLSLNLAVGNVARYQFLLTQ